MQTPDVVVLVPGLLGFTRFGGFYYFADRLIAVLRGLLEEPLGYPVPVVPVTTLPTASRRHPRSANADRPPAPRPPRPRRRCWLRVRRPERRDQVHVASRPEPRPHRRPQARADGDGPRSALFGPRDRAHLLRHRHHASRR